ncbi:hypothetical protein [Acinetobacter sp. ANC 5378]|uniref:hypothetical protein n=1 Tax=Acinetobacter sp. ANC 5378 TaxID=2731249 RepID=UPI00148FF21E|nr:hypothetical protein [Acinetobacter sp. ANC 5378]NNG82031.1 hypothetical protein [Acinetobacter sp. ANC 5378]
MCGKPKVVQQDPEGDAQKAAEKATAEANLKKSMRRTSTSTGSMSALGGQIEGAKTKTTLGGG